jgi:hypothetical protein
MNSAAKSYTQLDGLLQSYTQLDELSSEESYTQLDEFCVRGMRPLSVSRDSHIHSLMDASIYTA